jgi:hypothetical protein
MNIKAMIELSLSAVKLQKMIFDNFMVCRMHICFLRNSLLWGTGGHVSLDRGVNKFFCGRVMAKAWPSFPVGCL